MPSLDELDAATEEPALIVFVTAAEPWVRDDWAVCWLRTNDWSWGETSSMFILEDTAASGTPFLSMRTYFFRWAGGAPAESADTGGFEAVD